MFWLWLGSETAVRAARRAPTPPGETSILDMTALEEGGKEGGSMRDMTALQYVARSRAAFGMAVL